MFTTSEMRDIAFSDQINRDARAQECTALELMQSYESTPADIARYQAGALLLARVERIIYHHSTRSTLQPLHVAENQIVVDAGHIATSPAYMLVTIEGKRG